MQDRWNQKIFNYDQFSWALSGQLAEWSLALLSGEKIFENRKDPGFAPRPGQTFKLIWSILSHIKSPCHKVSKWHRSDSFPETQLLSDADFSDW